MSGQLIFYIIAAVVLPPYVIAAYRARDGLIVGFRRPPKPSSQCQRLKVSREHGGFFLRPFRETGSLSAQSTALLPDPMSYSGLRKSSKHIDLETLFRSAFGSLPFTALGHPTEKSMSSGATRIYFPDDAWWSQFEGIARQSSVILVLPDESANVVREILWL
jgi:hypothetical protein